MCVKYIIKEILTGRTILVYSPFAIAVFNSSLVTGLESRNLTSGK